jgi:acyl-coenzyme A synthetase/AMP-(fatty) acid ligase
VPKVIYVAAEMPRTPTGKIQRRHVAAAFLKKP